MILSARERSKGYLGLVSGPCGPEAGAASLCARRAYAPEHLFLLWIDLCCEGVSSSTLYQRPWQVSHPQPGWGLVVFVQPIQEATRHASGEQSSRFISEVIQLMLTGEIPEDIRPWLCGASLTALRKPNGPLRPVAMGETLRGLCWKVAVQVGVHTRAGCESVLRTIRQWTSTFCQRIQLRLSWSGALGSPETLSVDSSLG